MDTGDFTLSGDTNIVGAHAWENEQGREKVTIDLMKNTNLLAENNHRFQ